jgi:hypothetical protein
MLSIARICVGLVTLLREKCLSATRSRAENVVLESPLLKPDAANRLDASCHWFRRWRTQKLH